MNSNTEMHQCMACEVWFKSSRAVKTHIQRQKDCRLYMENFFDQNLNNVVLAASTNDDIEEEFTNLGSNNTCSDESILSSESDQPKKKFRYDLDFISACEAHYKEGFNIISTEEGLHNSQINLLDILKKSNAPLYLYDEIMKWACVSVVEHNVQFDMITLQSRANVVAKLKNQFQLNSIEPNIIPVLLNGSKQTVNLVVHDFKYLLYSLLNDNLLMVQENLLFNINNPYNLVPNKNVINDIDSGTVFQKAWKKHTSSILNHVLCPIIFFIDKTHTDNNGRLCLEQIRFTLGIFNRKTRNSAKAWRTLGYIADQQHIKTLKPPDKSIDYHQMIKIILNDYIESQEDAIAWDLIADHQSSEIKNRIHFITKVLFIIGDTDGHDKLAGRYTSRSNIVRLCRYCDCPFDLSDDPDYKYKYNQHSTIFKIVGKGVPSELQQISAHPTPNAWESIQFCDTSRGLFGALCADVMHCLQQGLHQYVIEMLFLQKKFKNITDQNENTNDEILYSTHSVFTDAYSKEFDAITKNYGKLLTHQSDRELPRTYFQTNYTSTTRKTASEMTGVLIVILITFNSLEGSTKLDQYLGEGRTSKFIHVLELMLLLENFCYSESHLRRNVQLFKLFIPFLLNTLKETLQRKHGCGMKLIKFHLPNHFADDIIRFGSMLNFDSGIGESHHKTEAKKPAKNTQRRKINFEFQTATRQIENLAITLGKDSISKLEVADTKPESLDKWFRYIYSEQTGLCHYLPQGNKELLKTCKWKDKSFQNALTNICQSLIKKGYIKGKFEFFSQHNRDNLIFRGDPNYKSNDPWHDWAEIMWEEGLIPSKLMIFWKISEDNFIKTFQIGSTYVANPGSYVLAYSLPSTRNKVKAHGSSLMVQYGTIKTDNNEKCDNISTKLVIFPIDCIANTLSAVPYNPAEDIIVAKEWLFLRTKSQWYDIFTTFMNKIINKQND